MAGVAVTYENGAEVPTSFVTSYGDSLLRSAPELYRIVSDVVGKLRREGKRPVPRHVYPDAVITSAMLGKYSKYGIDVRIKEGECRKIQRLDAQKPFGKSIYGSGFLLSKRAAAERAAAERFALSPREVELQRALDDS